MKLELGKIKIDDIQFAEKTYVKDHVLYVNKEEVEELVLEDDKLIGCSLDIARPGDIPRSCWKSNAVRRRRKNACAGRMLRCYRWTDCRIPGRCH